jgi:hypothetical protein
MAISVAFEGCASGIHSTLERARASRLKDVRKRGNSLSEHRGDLAHEALGRRDDLLRLLVGDLTRVVVGGLANLLNAPRLGEQLRIKASGRDEELPE